MDDSRYDQSSSLSWFEPKTRLVVGPRLTSVQGVSYR